MSTRGNFHVALPSFRHEGSLSHVVAVQPHTLSTASEAGDQSVLVGVTSQEDLQEQRPTKNHLRRRRQREKRKNSRLQQKESEQNDQPLQELGTAVQLACEDNSTDADPPTLLHMLAVEQLQSAWDALQAEFSVQVLIWQSQKISCNSRGEWISALEIPGRSEQVLQSHLDRALKTKSVTAIQAALRKNGQADGPLNNATVNACNQVVEADHLAELRWKLGVEVSNCQHNATAGRNVAQVQALLGDCRIEDSSLQNCVRGALGLPALDATSSTAQSSSGGNAMRNAQAGITQSRGSVRRDRGNLSHAAIYGFHVSVKNTFIEVESDLDSNASSTCTSTSSRRSLSTPASSTGR